MGSIDRKGHARVAPLLCLALIAGFLSTTPAAPAAVGDAWRLDDTFGTGGEVTTKFGSGFDEIFDVAVASDGKIIAVGQATPDGQSHSDFAVARYKEDGSLDTSFGLNQNGKVLWDFGGQAEEGARSVAIAADGRIVVVGFGTDSATQDSVIAVARFSSDGTNVQSKLFPEFGLSEANAVAIYPSGSARAGDIVVAGMSGARFGTRQFVIASLSPSDLELNQGFGPGGDGWIVPSLDTIGHNIANAIAILPNDKIVVAGTVDTQSFSVIGNAIGLLRLNVDGTLDAPFGGAGPRPGWAPAFTCICAGWGLGVRADGAIFVAGQSMTDDMGFNMVGWRYTGAGFAQTSFGADYFGRDDVARDVVFQPGKFVLVGWTAETGNGNSTNDLVHFALARFNNVPEAEDNTFGENSNKLTQAFAFGYDAALSAVVQRDGDIVAAGGSNQAAPGLQDLDFALARFTGPKSAPTDRFKAEMYEMRPFTLRPAPEQFRVFWRTEGSLSPVRFDVRRRIARFDETTFGPWDIIATKARVSSMLQRIQPGRTVCFSVRGHNDSFTTGWSKQECTSIPIDDRTLDKVPRFAWGSYNRSDCYRNTYMGNGGGTGAIGHIEAAVKHLAVIVAKGPGFGSLAVRVNDKVLKRISLQASSIKCQVLVNVGTFVTARRRDIDIVVSRLGPGGSFIDGVGASLVKD